MTLSRCTHMLHLRTLSGQSILNQRPLPPSNDNKHNKLYNISNHLPYTVSPSFKFVVEKPLEIFHKSRSGLLKKHRDTNRIVLGHHQVRPPLCCNVLQVSLAIVAPRGDVWPLHISTPGVMRESQRFRSEKRSLKEMIAYTVYNRLWNSDWIIDK